MNRALLVISLVFVGCGSTFGSGRVITEPRDVAAFRRIEVSSGLNVRAVTGERAVSITTDDNFMPLVQTFVANDTLHLRITPGTLPLTGNIFVDVSNDTYEALDASGGADVKLTATPASSFDVTTSGGSDVTIDAVTATEVHVDASGGSSVTMSGTATSADIVSSGGSGVHLRGLPLEALQLDASGGSTINARVSSTLTGSASGGSTVTILGTPSNRVSISGGADVVLDRE